MSISFDGTGDYLSKDNVNILNDSGMSSNSYSFTVSFWMRPEGKQDAMMWEQYDGSANQGRLGVYMTSGGALRQRYIGSYNNVAGAIAVSTTTWYHVVTTFEYGTRSLYLNTAVTTKSGNATSDHSTAGLDFKLGTGSTGGEFEGDIAEWAAWKTVLTAGDIASLYAGASALYIDSSNLLAYFPLGGPLVGSATGASGNAYSDVLGGTYDLTGNGDPTFVETPGTYGPAQTSSAMFYPQTYIGGDAAPFSTYVPVADETTPYVEENITGDDVIAEITQANLRKQGGISVNTGGINFNSRQSDENELPPFSDRNKNFIVAENYITSMNNRLVKANRQNQEDTIHGGGGDGNN